MRICIRLTLLVAFTFFLTGNAQEDPNSLESQFSNLLDKSNRYQDYKVLKIAELNKFQRSMGDSVSAFQLILNDNRNRIKQLEAKIDSLLKDQSQLQQDLALARKKENGMDVFGVIIPKTTYQLIVWTIIGALVLMVLILSFKFKNSNAITRQSNSKLAETEAEFDTHRQRALEREQQLRRKLQDEINKQKEN
jgi:septal ring factor EnvC (AmiA/AmiB activator)